MNPPKALIASTGRSGSGYIAKVLTEYGINCGHEDYFCFPWNKPKQVAIDSSWIATDQLERYEGIVFHQVRDPLKVLTSLTATAKPWQPPVSKVWNVRKRIMPYRTGSLQRDFMAMIVWMNNEIEKHAETVWKVEDICEAVIACICAECSYIFEYDKAQNAIKTVSETYNKHHDKEYLTWDDIPDSEEKEKLRTQAKRYGY